MQLRAILFLAALLVAPQADATKCPRGSLTGVVSHVRDGDTIVVGSMPIRLNGLAAPEGDEPGGAAATQAMIELVEGRTLRCELNGERTHDRCVGICYLEGTDISEVMVHRGVARGCPRFSQGRYTEAERQAAVDGARIGRIYGPARVLSPALSCGMATDPLIARDAVIRQAAFNHVRAMQSRDLVLSHEDIARGFMFEGQRWPLWNPQRGIFKPREMPFLLSIRTVFPRKGGRVWYDDQRHVHQQIFAGDDELDYAFMGTEAIQSIGNTKNQVVSVGGHLWLNRSARPLSSAAIRHQIESRTEQAFGKAIWPHLFRDCAVTELVDSAPEQIGIAPDLLGHADLQTTKRHYIQAVGMKAHVLVQEVIAARRRGGTARGESGA